MHLMIYFENDMIELSDEINNKYWFSSLKARVVWQIRKGMCNDY